jgi:hypothetical protein
MSNVQDYILYNLDNGNIVRVKRMPEQNISSYVSRLRRYENVAYITGRVANASNWCVNVSVDPHVVEKKTDLPTHDHWASLRTKRTNLLKHCDWTQAPDSPLSDSKKAEWQTYRQALRDITTGLSDPTSVTWPTEPS